MFYDRVTIWRDIMERTFYHRFGGFQDTNSIHSDIACILECLDRIMKSGALLSKRQLYQDQASAHGCNGKDYLSICQKFPQNLYTPEFRSGFYEFVYGQFCFLLDDQMEVERPQVIPTDFLNYYTWKPDPVFLQVFPSLYHEKNLYTDVMDEWMVRDQIPLEHVKALAFPYDILQHILPDSTLNYVCHTMKQVANQLGVPLLDSAHKQFGETMEETVLYQPQRMKKNRVYSVQNHTNSGQKIKQYVK